MGPPPRAFMEAIAGARENVRYLPGIEARLEHRLHVRSRSRAGRCTDGRLRRTEPRDAGRRARLPRPTSGRASRSSGATKGIENDSLMFMDEILTEELPAHARHQLTFLSGPSFAKELAVDQPTAVVIAAHDASVGAEVMQRFHTPYLRTYGSDDVAGVECGGALKNVIAIAAGAAAGMGFGHNTRAAARSTRGLANSVGSQVARGGLRFHARRARRPG